MLRMHAGPMAALVVVQDKLREFHEDRQKSRAKRIEKREADGFPLDDGTPEKPEPLEPLPDYVPDPALDGVKARFNILTDREVRDFYALEIDAHEAVETFDEEHADAVAAAAAAGKRAPKFSKRERNRLIEGIFDVRRAYVKAAVIEVQIPVRGGGIKEIKKIDDAALEVLEKRHLILPLCDLAAALQELPEGKD